jgi:PAS domain S-box-containing protein
MMTSGDLPLHVLPELRQRLKWSLFSRVVIVSGLAVLLLLFLRIGSENPVSEASWLGALIATGYLHALLCLLLLSRTKHLVLLCHASIAFDLIWVSLCLLLIGGVQTPFPILYNLVILNGSVLLLRKGAFSTALFATLCYGIVHLVLPGWEDLRRLFPFVVNVSSFFSIALLGGYLAKRMTEAHQLLENQSREYGQLVSLKDTLVKNLDCGIVITDGEGSVSYMNRPAEEMVGVKSGDVAGSSLDTAIPELLLGRENDQKGVIGNAPRSGEIVVTRTGLKKSLSYSFLPLPGESGVSPGDLVIIQDVTQIRHQEEQKQKEEELKRKWQEQGTVIEESEFTDIVGRAGGMGQVFSLIRKTAGVSANVLITGESGTGKELVAKAIHKHSKRSQGRFVAVNCGAIPENLIESELFGHIKGAFTGAVADRPGLFFEANGGTIFFDEVGELPLHLQVKLLRVLQDRIVTPVGGNKPTKVDVRVISASNRDLKNEVEKGRFREDLYFRLNVIRIPLPPLRKRIEDIPLLVHHFVKHYSDKEAIQVSPKALGVLMGYSYPGNIRELENIIEHACAMTSSSEIDVEDLPEAIARQKTLTDDYTPKAPIDVSTAETQGANRADHPSEPQLQTGAKTLVEVEREHIRNVLEMTGWRIRGSKGAAAILGLKPTTLASRLKILGLERPSPIFRRPDDISSA